MSLLLALDTATPDTVVGLRLPAGETITRRHRPAEGERPGHVTQLLPLASEALAEAGQPWTAITRIAVGVGPGTFTGLRIGVATARALAATAGAELVGVSTLAALAAAGDDGTRVVAALDARRREVFAAAWADAARAAAVRDPEIGPVAVAPADLGGLIGLAGALVVGDGAVRYRDALTSVGARIPADEDPAHAIDPVVLCDLAARTAVGPEVLPAYVRRPDAIPTALRGRT